MDWYIVYRSRGGGSGLRVVDGRAMAIRAAAEMLLDGQEIIWLDSRPLVEANDATSISLSRAPLQAA